MEALLATTLLQSFFLYIDLVYEADPRLRRVFKIGLCLPISYTYIMHFLLKPCILAPQKLSKPIKTPKMPSR